VNVQPGRIAAPRELFRSDDLLVRRRGGFGGNVCYVTFDSYTDNRTLDRQGFGELYFDGRGIDAIHVLSCDNRWYQYDELPRALAAIASATRNYERVIAYGSSMGGFAALHYGSACGATIGIALSPQYSVDPAVVPFERRWADDAARIAFRDHDIPALETEYIVYDPRDAHDRRHFALFAARAPVEGIEVPHGGHPVAAYLSETGLLGPLLEATEAGALDAAAFTAELRRRRRRSGHYFSILAERTPPYRPRQKVALAELAVRTQEDNAVYHSQLAVALDAAGEHERAYPVHRRAIEMTGGGVHQHHKLVLHLEQRGELGRAIELAEQLVADHPDVLWLPRLCQRLRRKRRHSHWAGRVARMLGLDPLLDQLSG